ncbi:MAG: hemerythrin domain-containing protein [Methanoregulaceae archaeon]|jgi:hemerythrin-like domain-containing protein|nr:hemerythrin domain-containing protein [Methanoregulaceae archaeon]
MTEPVDAVRAFHNAFRNDIRRIDEAAFETAKGTQGLASTIERFRFFNEILVWHATGEEAAVFPAIEKVAPLVAEPYVMDHRGLDRAYDELNESYSANDPLKTARATAAFRFHLAIHLDKEDAHLYRIFRERLSPTEKVEALTILAGKVPQKRFPEVVTWLYPLIGIDDRVNMTRIWQMVLPAPAFAGVQDLIKKAIGPEWDELTQRIPTL